MSTLYRSKVGIGPLIYAAGILVTIFTIMIVNKLWAGAILTGLVISFISHMYLNTWYKVYDKKLKIKCGFRYNKTIDIENIKKLTETNDPINSPALSLDRLEILYDKTDRILISPANKMGFITHLMQLKPEITVRLKEHSK